MVVVVVEAVDAVMAAVITVADVVMAAVVVIITAEIVAIEIAVLEVVLVSELVAESLAVNDDGKHLEFLCNHKMFKKGQLNKLKHIKASKLRAKNGLMSGPKDSVQD